MGLFTLAYLAVILATGVDSQQNSQKRLVCQMMDADPNEPIQLPAEDGGLKVIPFSLSLEKSRGDESVLSDLLKNLPEVSSSDDIQPLRIQTAFQNISVTCDMVSSDVENKIKNLEDKIKKLTSTVEKLEESAECPNGMTYLDRCFRLMEIRGKLFPRHKAEDLCNYNGGVLAELDNALVFTAVASYVRDRFSDPKYGNKTVLHAWTGMTYEIPTVGVAQGPFSPPNQNQSNERLSALNAIVSWFPGFPKQLVTHDKLALQFRFSGPNRKRIISAGVINSPRRRRFVPLCQFYLQDWQKADSVSARLFRFNL